MPTITILPESSEPGGTYRAVSGASNSIGHTVGEALDALTAQIDGPQETTLVIVQRFQPDGFFTGEQRKRLTELMERWRAARDTGQSLPPAEQAELESLTNAEMQGSKERAAALLRELQP
jgi:hypothetical protein